MTSARLLLEHPGYSLVRFCVASLGAFALGAGAVELSGGIPRSDGPIPALTERLPAAVAQLGVGVFCLVPFRWTLRRWAFRVRLAVLAAVGAFLALRGVQAVVLGVAGGRDPLIFPVGLSFVLLGVGLPATLWWRRAISHRVPATFAAGKPGRS